MLRLIIYFHFWNRKRELGRKKLYHSVFQEASLSLGNEIEKSKEAKKKKIRGRKKVLVADHIIDWHSANLPKGSCSSCWVTSFGKKIKEFEKEKQNSFWEEWPVGRVVWAIWWMKIWFHVTLIYHYKLASKVTYMYMGGDRELLLCLPLK